MKNYFFLLWYYFKNLISDEHLVNEKGSFHVSLTTHGDRIFRVFAAIESACNSLIKPQKIYLFLDQEDEKHLLPKTLLRLQRRGLSIVYCENVGPHKKHHPYLQLNSSLDVPLITIDDDVFYENTLLSDLYSALIDTPKIIHCTRARKVIFSAPFTFSPYAQWPICSDTTASTLNFSTGVGGVIYPPEFMQFLKNGGDGFRQLCPSADDIWIHLHAVRGNFQVRQISNVASSFPDIPGSRKTALFKTNLHQGKNDIQLRQSYTEQDMKTLWSSR